MFLLANTTEGSVRVATEGITQFLQPLWEGGIWSDEELEDAV